MTNKSKIDVIVSALIDRLYKKVENREDLSSDEILKLERLVKVDELIQKKNEPLQESQDAALSRLSDSQLVALMDENFGKDKDKREK